MDARLSAEQEAEYREIFGFWDKEKAGTIDLAKLKLLMKSLGEELTDQELNKMAPGGRIDFNAFLANRQDKWAKAQSGEDVINAFAFFDVNGDGRVPVELLRGVLTQLGEPLSDAEFNKMVQDAEGTGGAIDYRRFVEKMKKNAY
eukprot:TRINITY_DN14769_c0_g1_i1.p1 TRINITY_DN14769_c0_g1~~TRINITY_DN14769_c0_g1_i1.p1  ORF type:complete len:145 (-),score=54.79 TRINITY_DN14769_c0_g1_i1:71-505(-)